MISYSISYSHFFCNHSIRIFFHFRTSVFILSHYFSPVNQQKRKEPRHCRGSTIYVGLAFDDFQDLHGASLGADATSNALRGSAAFLQDHNLHGAGFHALAARNTELLINHVDAGLGILGNSTMLTNLHALATLDASHGLGLASLVGADLDGAECHIKFLIECFGASLNALQTSHALFIFLNSQFLHKRIYPFYIFYDYSL